MAFDRGWVVSEGLGDDCYRGELAEFGQGAKTRCSDAAADLSDSLPEGMGGEVLAGGVAAKDPGAVRVSSCLVVLGVGGELTPGAIEGVGQHDLKVDEPDGDDVVGHCHVLPGELDDVLDLLGEHEHEDRCGAITWSQVVGFSVRSPLVRATSTRVMAPPVM